MKILMDYRAVVINPDGTSQMVKFERPADSDALSNDINSLVGDTAMKIELKPKGGRDKGAVVIFGSDKDQPSNAAANEFILLRGKSPRGKNPILCSARGVAIVLGQFEDGTIKNDCPTWVYNTLSVPWTEWNERQVINAK